MYDYQQAYGAQPFAPQQFGPQQFAPQSLGSMFGGTLGGLAGSGLGSLFGNAGLGGRIGQSAGNFLGSLSPFSVDPAQQQLQQLQQLQAQQGQLSPQGFSIGNLISQLGGPAGQIVGQLTGNQNLGSTISDISGLGRLLPFSVDPAQQQLQQLQQLQGQQGQLSPQGFSFGNLISGLGGTAGQIVGQLTGNKALGNTISDVSGFGRLLPFSADPVQQQQLQQLQQLQAQQGQLSPQGFSFGNLISGLGGTAGQLVGQLTGNRALGNTISDVSGLGRLLPFSADPQAVAQQGPAVQMQQLQAFHQHLQQLIQQVQQQQAALQQQAMAQQAGGAQLAPQSGWVNNLVGQIAQPVGNYIGTQLGNPALGGAIGAIASQLGRMIPFQADPYSAYAQQAQQYGGQQTLH